MATKRSIAYLGQNLNMALSALADYLAREKEKEQYQNVVGQSQLGPEGWRGIQQIGLNVQNATVPAMRGAIPGLPSTMEVNPPTMPSGPGWQPSQQETNEMLMRALVNMAPFNRYAQGGLQAQMAKKRLDAPDFQLGPYDTAWKGGQEVARGIGGKQVAPESQFLRREWINENGVKKAVDIYGYTQNGNEVITEQKYSDFTPSGSGGSDPKQTIARIKQLRDRNIAIGREMVAINTEPVLADESGKSSPTVWNPTTGKFESESGVVAGDEAAGGIYANRKARKEQLARELQENERLLEELNSMIGGSFKAGGQSPVQQPQAEQYVVGQEYVDADGNHATYLGNGQWQPK